MLGVLSRAFDRFRGSGAAAVTIPSLDGAFRPNQQLDAASVVLEIDTPDNLVSDGSGVFFTGGATLYELELHNAPATAKRLAAFEKPIACLDAHPKGGVAVGLADGGIVLCGGAHDGKVLSAVEGRSIRCPTALRFADAGTIIVCLGSQENDPSDWKRDLLYGNSSGSVWRIDVRSGRGSCLADGLAWPGGVAQTASGQTVIAEAWRHQLVDIGGGSALPILSDIPGYPARLAASVRGGYWLAIFAPRSQLIEFVLREPRFRQRMMLEVEPEFWVAPSLHHMIDYREPLQAGAIKQLGELKPWSPSRSYGLIARLDEAFNPIESFHSRANGKRHGITSCVEIEGRLLATSKGGGVILGIDLSPAQELTA